MESSFTKRSTWLNSLDKFLSNSKNLERYSFRNSKTKCTLGEFLNAEKRFYALFKKAFQKKEFQVLLAQEIELNKESKRTIFSFDVFDNFIYFHIESCLKERVKLVQSKRVFGLAGSGVELALNDLQLFLKNNQSKKLWVIRRDLKNYGMSLPHSGILDFISKKIVLSEHELSLLQKLLKFPYVSKVGSLEVNAVGVPTGTRLQQFLGNLYLSEIDKYFEEAARYYIRYGDDILVIADSEEQLKRVKNSLDTQLHTLGLQLNPNKSFEFEYVNNSRVSSPLARDRFEYLGREITRTGKILISDNKFQSIKNKLEVHLRKTNQILNDYSPDRRIESLCMAASEFVYMRYFNGQSIGAQHLTKIHSSNDLRQLDEWLALKVLQIGLKRGFKRSNFRFYTPTTLRKFGLPNIARWS